MGMKYLKTFENYEKLNITKKGGEVISKELFLDLENKHCKKYKNLKELTIPLYRGIPISDMSDYYYIYPKGDIRKSIEFMNIHVILMSELDSWKKYPPYNQSIIATTDKTTASSYSWANSTFEVIPYDNTRVVVCNERNIWEVYGGYINSQNVIRVVNNFLTSYLSKLPEKWNLIKKEIMKHNVEERINSIPEAYEEDCMTFIENLIKWKSFINLNEITPEMIIEYIEYLFDPEKYGFQLLEYNEDYPQKMRKLMEKYGHDLQVYCEGPVLMKKIYNN